MSIERLITHQTRPARPGSPPANYVIEGDIMRHVPSGFQVTIREPKGTAELRRAHYTLRGLVRFSKLTVGPND